MKTLLSTLAVCAAMTASSASAATLVSGMIGEDTSQVLDSDGTFHADIYGGAYDNTMAAHSFDDFGNVDADPLLAFTGNAWIFGYLKSPWSDIFAIEASNYTYSLQFTVLDGDLNMGVTVGGGLGTVLTTASSLLQFDNLSGDTLVSLDGLSGSGRWLVDVVNWTENPAPVPLPASSLLLLAGLGGLGAMSRRKKA